MLKALVADTIRILTIPPGRSEKPTLLTFVAPPGSGKSHLSDTISKRLGFTVLPEERLQTFLNPSPTYFSLKLENIFELSSTVIGELLKSKINVIFDSNVGKKADRVHLAQIAKEANSNFVLIHMVTSDEVILDRLNKKNLEIVGGTRYGVVLNREYYLAEKNKIEEPLGEETIDYDSGLGEAEVERIIRELRLRIGFRAVEEPLEG